jgi:hypothetical protein
MRRVVEHVEVRASVMLTLIVCVIASLWCSDAVAQWGKWENRGVSLIWRPILVSRAPGTLEVFSRSNGNRLWMRPWHGSRPSDWRDLGGTLASDPACVAPSANRIDCVSRSTAGQLWHIW